MSTMGRPSSYSPDLCELAHNYCLLGATNDELAAFFGVSPRTIDNWIAVHPEFESAVKDGRVIADARVARGLYTRAIGYDRKVEREILHQGELRTLTSVVHYPPNPQSCIFWLRNRRRRTWRERPNDPSTPPIDHIALLDAAGESVRHHDRD
jgi:hypothetical protein